MSWQFHFSILLCKYKKRQNTNPLILLGLWLVTEVAWPLGSCAERCTGSSPATRTKNERVTFCGSFLFLWVVIPGDEPVLTEGEHNRCRWRQSVASAVDPCYPHQNKKSQVTRLEIFVLCSQEHNFILRLLEQTSFQTLWISRKNKDTFR